MQLLLYSREIIYSKVKKNHLGPVNIHATLNPGSSYRHNNVSLSSHVNPWNSMCAHYTGYKSSCERNQISLTEIFCYDNQEEFSKFM